MGRHAGPPPLCPRCRGCGRELIREWRIIDQEPQIVRVPGPVACEVCRGTGLDPFA